MIMASYSKHILRNFMVAVLICLSSFGCTNAQLRRSTVAHSMTLSDIYTQQVLNNLAMFVQNPNSLPFFAFPNQGTTSIQDTGNIGNPGYSSGHFSSSAFLLNASRQATENWVLVPVSDPAKLALMRCAYQQAIASTMSIRLSDGAGCPDCAELRSDFYGPKVSATRKLDPGAEAPCLEFPPWFTWGCEKHAKLPKNRACQTIGSYCGTFVCVPPESRDMLTRLTTAILDYAVNDPTQFVKRTKDVALFLDARGQFTTVDKAVKTIKATIPIDQKSEDLRILDNGTVWLKFFENGFKKKDADDLVTAARSRIEQENEKRKKERDRLDGEVKNLESRRGPLGPEQKARLEQLKKERQNPDLLDLAPTLLNEPAWWGTIQPTDYPLVLPGVVEFFQQYAPTNRILPQETPSEELLKGPATFQRKSEASAGLQMLQQRLKAVSGG
jgi:hypothetical protein